MVNRGEFVVKTWLRNDGFIGLNDGTGFWDLFCDRGGQTRQQQGQIQGSFASLEDDDENKQRQRQRQIPWDDKQKDMQQQRQRRNTGISPLRRQSAPPSVEMTCIWVVRGRRVIGLANG
jgi:hypothetical protein